MVKILGEPFDPYVDTQVTIRQNSLRRHPKGDDDIKVFNTSTPWIRLSSSIFIDKTKAEQLSKNLGIPVDKISGVNLAKNLVLFAGTTEGIGGSQRGGVGYGLNNVYGFLSDENQGYKPMPGITSISTNYKNNGALKQAQIKLKCYTRKQFEALEALYLRLGYTVVLEYGHSVYFDNEGIKQNMSSLGIPNMLFSTPAEKVPITTVQATIKSNKEDTGGNYDALVAKVSNFSWSLGNDLSYDITLELISVGDIIDSLKMNLGGIASAVSEAGQATTDAGTQNLLNIQLNKSTGKFVTFLQELVEQLSTKEAKKETSPATQAAIEAKDTAKALSENLNEIKTPYLDRIAAIGELFKSYDKIRNLLKGREVTITQGFGIAVINLTPAAYNSIKGELAIAAAETKDTALKFDGDLVSVSNNDGLPPGVNILNYFGLDSINTAGVIGNVFAAVSGIELQGTLEEADRGGYTAVKELTGKLEQLQKYFTSLKPEAFSGDSDSESNIATIETLQRLQGNPKLVIEYMLLGPVYSSATLTFHNEDAGAKTLPLEYEVSKSLLSITTPQDVYKVKFP